MPWGPDDNDNLDPLSNINKTAHPLTVGPGAKIRLSFNASPNAAWEICMIAWLVLGKATRQIPLLHRSATGGHHNFDNVDGLGRTYVAQLAPLEHENVTNTEELWLMEMWVKVDGPIPDNPWERAPLEKLSGNKEIVYRYSNHDNTFIRVTCLTGNIG